MKAKFKKLKMRVPNKELGAYLQKVLFSFGYERFSGTTNIYNDGFSYMFTDERGVISYSHQLDIFLNSDADILCTDFIKAMMPDKREVIEIGGKNYYKDELELALANIKSID